MRNAVKLFALIALGTTMMYAQASRTWVSGVGDDANPCSRTAPCKTFAGAISKTAPGGEIDALDPAGFGAVTITKGITIDGGGGQVASVLVSGTNGIVVQAGPSDVVILRNLRINGIGTGINGIRFLAGKTLIVENVDVFGFTTNGIDIALGQSGSSAIIEHTNVQNVGGAGFAATDTVSGVRVAIRNSNVMGCGGNGVQAGNNAVVAVDNVEITFCNNAVTATTGGVGIVGGSVMAFNSGTAYNVSGGSIFAFAQGTATASNGTNRVHDNGATGSPTAFITQN